MSAASIRAGGAFVEITANDTQFQRTLKKTQHSIVRLHNSLFKGGSGMAIAGGAMAAPMLLAARSAAVFQDSLLELRGAASELSQKDFADLRNEALRLSRAMGIAPSRIAAAFTLLVKAGMPVAEVLSGAGKAAVEFAQISGVEAAQAAEFMKVAMNVFGVSAEEAANTLSAAADSSETSIAAMVESFALVASVAKGTRQSLFGLSQGIAILARYGIKGEEAGTGIKTLLVKLLAPTKDAKEALAQLGLSMESFVDESGAMLPLAQIAEIFARSMRGMSTETKKAMLSNEALVKVFDVRGIRVIKAFGEQGEEGFKRMETAMKSSRSVADKFTIAMSELTGVFNALMAVAERAAISFADGGFTSGVKMASSAVITLIDVISYTLSVVPGLSLALAAVAGTLLTVGVAALGVGAILSLVNFALRGYITWTVTATMLQRAFTVSIGGLGTAFTALGAAIKSSNAWAWASAVGNYIANTKIAVGVTYAWTAAVNTLTAAFGKLGLAASVGKLGIFGIFAAIAAGMFKMGMDISEQKSMEIERKNRSPVLLSDPNRKPLAGQGGGMPSTGLGAGETLGTFNGSVLRQLAIGPALTVAQETADNTGRAADGIEELVANSKTLPAAAGVRAGIAAAAPVAAGGVAATSDRELISAAERTAMSSERMLEELRRMKPAPGLHFV